MKIFTLAMVLVSSHAYANLCVGDQPIYYDTPPCSVPEPGTLAVLVVGLIVLAMIRCKKC